MAGRIWQQQWQWQVDVQKGAKGTAFTGGVHSVRVRVRKRVRACEVGRVREVGKVCKPAPGEWSGNRRHRLYGSFC